MRVRAIIYGRVQGVFFRRYTQEQAISLQIKGWVKNNFNGTVEAIFDGQESRVSEMIEWCQHGPTYASVEKVEIAPDNSSEQFQDFSIR